MITGAHFLFYSKNPEADRVFFRDVLGFCSVDVGEGWLIFAMPPAEAGIHPLVPLPSGGAIGLYQPKHPTAFKSQSK